MADVTFGVKVSEEMKNELSQIMKEHTLSGKEFMSMLLASYHLDQAKNESELFESDLIELEKLIKRIAHIFINMTEKSKLAYQEEVTALEKVIQTQQEEKEKGKIEQEELKTLCNKMKEEKQSLEKKVEEKQQLIEKQAKEIKAQKVQLENTALLHEKFQDEVHALKQKIEEYQRLEIEIEERNTENNKLKTRNDEVSSENWFLKREIEKIQQEKEQMVQKYQESEKNTQIQFELQLKNQLLEEQLNFNKICTTLKEEIISLKEEKALIIQEYEAKINALHKINVENS